MSVIQIQNVATMGGKMHVATRGQIKIKKTIAQQPQKMVAASMVRNAMMVIRTLQNALHVMEARGIQAGSAKEASAFQKPAR